MLSDYPFIVIDGKHKRGKCCAYKCSNKPKKKSRFCYKHIHRLKKHKDPIAYAFYALMSNAKRRGKTFAITLAEFRIFCYETNYIEFKGKSKKSASIDRIDNSKGYSIDNIRCVTLNENSSKNCYQTDDIPF